MSNHWHPIASRTLVRLSSMIALDSRPDFDLTSLDSPNQSHSAATSLHHQSSNHLSPTITSSYGLITIFLCKIPNHCTALISNASQPWFQAPFWRWLSAHCKSPPTSSSPRSNQTATLPPCKAAYEDRHVSRTERKHSLHCASTRNQNSITDIVTAVSKTGALSHLQKPPQTSSSHHLATTAAAAANSTMLSATQMVLMADAVARRAGAVGLMLTVLQVTRVRVAVRWELPVRRLCSLRRVSL
jgi:hypothetical protein